MAFDVEEGKLALPDWILQSFGLIHEQTSW